MKSMRLDAGIDTHCAGVPRDECRGRAAHGKAVVSGLRSRRLGPREVCLIAMCCLSGFAVGQETPPSERTFFEPVEVSVVNLEVLVTDEAGQPVRGLTVGDFEVHEDGEPVDITHFYAAPDVAAPGLPATPPISPEREADQDLYLTVVLVDSNLKRTDRRRSIDNLRNFLSMLPDNTYVMLARCADELQILQPFTNDRAQLRSALVRAEAMACVSLAGEEDRIRREMQTLAEQNPPSGTSALPDDHSLRPLEMSDFGSSAALSYVQHIKAYAAAAAAQTERTLLHVQRLIRSLAGLHGRRAVLVISDGIAINPGSELFREWDQVFSYIARATNINPEIEAQTYDLSQPVSALANSANADKVTFHVITSRGRNVLTSAGADREGGVTLGSGLGVELAAGGRADVLLADITGGRTMVNGRNLTRELNELLLDVGSYYSLGFRPGHDGDEAYHRIRVEVRGDKLGLRYRDGYRHVGGAQRIADRTLTAAVLGLTENPLRATVEYRDQEPRADGLYLVRVVVRVPISELSLLPQPDNHEGKVSIVIVVGDDKGSLAEMKRREYPITIPHQQFLSALDEDAEFIMGLLMRRGKHNVAVGVRDDLGNIDSTLTVEVNVGELML